MDPTTQESTLCQCHVPITQLSPLPPLLLSNNPRTNTSPASHIHHIAFAITIITAITMSSSSTLLPLYYVIAPDRDQQGEHMWEYLSWPILTHPNDPSLRYESRILIQFPFEPGPVLARVGRVIGDTTSGVRRNLESPHPLTPHSIYLPTSHVSSNTRLALISSWHIIRAWQLTMPVRHLLHEEGFL
jgi:hypothetical protein